MVSASDSDSKLRRHVTYCTRTAAGMEVKGSQAELDTAQLLADNLTRRQHGDFRILVNYNMPVRGAGAIGTREMDVILVNRLGIFVIEVKDWTGLVDAYDNYWLQNNQFQHANVFLTVNDKAKSLRGQLFDRRGPLSHLGRISVTGLIVLARGRRAFRNHTRHNDRIVVGLDTTDLVGVVSSREFLFAPDCDPLSDPSIQEVHDTLFVQHRPHDQIIVGSKWLVVKDLTPTPLCRTYEAANLHLPTQRVRLEADELVDVSRGGLETKQRIMQSATAVTTMGTHPNIVQTLDLFPHPDRPDLVYEVTELVRGWRLDELLARRQPLPYEEQLDIVEALAAALEHSHRHQIYHRNLRPETVYRSVDGLVKLADFDYAKIESAKHTIVQPGRPFLETSSLTAPEVRIDATIASPASDIYSLGVLWYLMARDPSAPLAPGPDDVAGLAIPGAASQLLQHMIVTAVRGRPLATEVIAEVRRLKSQPQGRRSASVRPRRAR